jgi:membrane-associated phospholipid phosphatase
LVNRIIAVSNIAKLPIADLKRLFVQWGEYYTIPLHWKSRQWLFFAGFIVLLVVSTGLDEPIRYLFLAVHGSVEGAVCGVVHWFGTGRPSLYLFIGLYVGGAALASEKTRLGGLMILQSYLYSGAITISLKSIVGRWRPAAGHGHLTFSPMIAGPNAHLSFPSGDVAVVFSLAIVMAHLWRNRLWKVFWILLAILTSLSRIYYDAHWFSDVAFSTVNAVAAATWVVRRYEQERGPAVVSDLAT